jgi:hypothetical protein
MRKNLNNSIVDNTIMTFPLLHDPLEIYFKGKEIADFEKVLSYYCPDFDMNFFNFKSYEKTRDMAIKYKYEFNEMTILSRVLMIKVPLHVDFQESNVIRPKSFKLSFEESECFSVSVQYKFTEEFSSKQRLAVMISILDQSIKEEEDFKFNFLMNGLKQIHDIDFVDRESLDELFLEKCIKYKLDNIRLKDVLTTDAEISHLKFNKEDFIFEVNYPEKINGAARNFIFKKKSKEFYCKSVEFIDQKRKTIDVKKQDEELKIHYESNHCRMNFYGDNDYLIFKYKDNVYPKQFDRFLLSNEIFSVFDLEYYVKGLKRFDVFNECCSLPEICRGVLNVLIKKGYQMYLEEVLDKKIDDNLSTGDYELLKMNFEMMTHYEKMYESVLPKLEVFMNSCDRFGQDVGSDEHLDYLKNKFGDEDGDN